MLEEDDYDELMQEVAKGQEAEKPPSPGLALSPPPHPGRHGSGRFNKFVRCQAHSLSEIDSESVQNRLEEQR